MRQFVFVTLTARRHFLQEEQHHVVAAAEVIGIPIHCGIGIFGTQDNAAPVTQLADDVPFAHGERNAFYLNVFSLSVNVLL